MDRGLPSVRSARGLQGRQELGRMLVCVTDFVLRLGALGQLLRETSKGGQEVERGVLSLGRGCVVLERGFGHTA